MAQEAETKGGERRGDAVKKWREMRKKEENKTRIGRGGVTRESGGARQRRLIRRWLKKERFIDESIFHKRF